MWWLLCPQSTLCGHWTLYVLDAGSSHIDVEAHLHSRKVEEMQQVVKCNHTGPALAPAGHQLDWSHPGGTVEGLGMKGRPVFMKARQPFPRGPEARGTPGESHHQAQ